MVKPGYKQTDLGLLPEEWACREIGSFADVCMCKRIFAEQTTEMGEIPFYKIGTFGKKADAYISRPLFEEYKQKYSYPQKGDVLISAAGTLGRTVVYDGEEAYFQDSNIVWLDIDKSQISNDYLYHYYKVIKWTPSEGSTIARLYNGIITSTNVAVPPKPEQEAIAEALTDIDTLIVNLEKLIAKKKAIKQGAMQELLTGKRRLPGFTEEWKINKIGAFGEFVSGSCFPLAYQGKQGERYPFYKVSDFNNPGNERNLNQANNYISPDTADYLGCKIIPEKAIVIAKIGAAIFLERKKLTTVCCCIDNNMMAFVPFDVRSAQFICYVFQSMKLGELAEATALPSLSGKTICSVERKFPQTIEEQMSIATVLADMDSEIDVLSEKLSKYRMIKSGMMSELLTGRIRLIDKEDA